MPDGNPDFVNIINYPKVVDLAKENYKVTVFSLTAIVRDFCSSFNVVRNMNEDQILEAALCLIDEADNFRMEDFVIMFSLAKKGKLDIKIMDRIDIDVINKIWDCYYQKRVNAKYDIEQKSIEQEEAQIPDMKNIVGAEAWGELVKRMEADYSEGKAGHHLSEDEQLKAKKERIAHAAKHFWGENKAS